MEDHKVEEEVSEKISKSEKHFFSRYSVDCRDRDNIVGVICKEEGYNQLIEKVGYEGFCDCFLGKRFTNVDLLKIWCENKLVNP